MTKAPRVWLRAGFWDGFWGKSPSFFVKKRRNYE